MHLWPHIKQQAEGKGRQAALTNAIGQTAVEMLNGTSAHLADLVLAWLFIELFVESVLGAEYLQQLLLQLVQLVLQRSGAGGCRCIQIIQCERRESCKLVGPAGQTDAEGRSGKLRERASDTRAMFGTGLQRLH